MVLIAGLTPISETLSARWIRNDPLPASGVAAAVALSAGINPDTSVTSEALDHLLLAAELVARGRARVLVTTTTTERYPPGIISSAIDQSRIVALLHQDSAWLRTPETHTTRDEAMFAARLLQPRGIRSIAVVASPIHTRRACSTFEAVGFTVYCVASRNRDPDGQVLGQGPADRITVLGALVYELAALAEYRARGWLYHA